MPHTEPGDRYTHGHHPSVVDQHRRRTAEDAAAFVLPRLASGMRILDFGCGPGSITLGLAQRVPQGQVVGIDVVPEVLEQARELAQTRGADNVRFERGDVYRLDYADNSFDVAYGHQVLQHLTDPVGALRELQRVVRPGGLVAVRDVDYGTMVHSPVDPMLVAWLDLYHEVTRRNGAEADAGRHLLRWMTEAGLSEPEMSASAWTFFRSRQTLNWGDSWARRTTESDFAQQAISYGLASAEELAAYAEHWRRWARQPSAFFCFLHVEGLAEVI